MEPRDDHATAEERPANNRALWWILILGFALPLALIALTEIVMRQQP
jgi:hypothetical protein